MVNLFAWIGTALLCAAPFAIDTDGGKIAAMLGLFLLCFQAYSKTCYNLILLNITGILGYATSLYF